MRKMLRNTLAVVSAVIAIMLAAGYFFDAAVWTNVKHAAENTQTAYSLQLNGGQILAAVGTVAQQAGAASGDVQLGYRWRWRSPWLHSVFMFQADSVDGPPPISYVAFPAWCLILPCMILPSIAVVRWKRQRGGRAGFTVEPTADA